MRVPSGWRRAVDAVLVAALAVLFFVSGRPDDPAGVLLGALVVLPLWFRRSHPVAVAVVITLAYSTWALGGYITHPLGALPAAVAMYSVGEAERTWRAKLAGFALLITAFSVISVGLLGLEPLEAVFFDAVFAGMWWVGTVVAGRRRYAAQLEERTAELEAARRELADKAVAEERLRIARELHDVVSHSLVTITVQAAVGSHLAGRDQARAAEALSVIETTGRSTLEELRGLLGMMRDPGAAGSRSPQPDLGAVESLVQATAEAGLDVSFVLTGDPAPLSQLAEVSVYRVVQESLTNAMKHAPGSSSTVALHHRPEAVEVEVTTSGGPVHPAGTGGLGLEGMAERVALLDGELAAGPTPDGWRVWARIPRSGP